MLRPMTAETDVRLKRIRKEVNIQQDVVGSRPTSCMWVGKWLYERPQLICQSPGQVRLRGKAEWGCGHGPQRFIRASTNN